MSNCACQNKEPVMVFKDKAEARQYLNEWKSRLFLNDWVIDITIVSTSELSNPEHAGEIESLFMAQSACISLVAYDERVHSDGILKFCHEQILVHELLHCKLSLLSVRADTYEAAFLNYYEHQTLEQIAKSLIMAKYNISVEWFSNI